MKRSLINKLGTAMNTIGSLGVGYYAAKFHLLQDIRAFDILDQTQWVQFAGSVFILGIGLVLRIRDLVERKHETDELKKEADWADEVSDQNTERVNELQDRLEDTEGLLDTVIRRVVLAELPEIVEDYLENRAPSALVKLDTSDVDGELDEEWAK